MISSAAVAFDWPIRVSSPTLSLMPATVACCSSIAVAIAPISLSVSATPPAISCILPLTSRASATPFSACSVAWRTCSAMSWARLRELPASLPTSSATTAKPLPCSPARAASIEALSDSMLVWLAMREMASAMWLICVLFSEMAPTSSTMLVICWISFSTRRAA